MKSGLTTEPLIYGLFTLLHYFQPESPSNIRPMNNIYKRSLMCVWWLLFRVQSSPDGAHQHHHWVTHVRRLVGCGVLLSWQWTMGNQKKDIVHLAIVFGTGWERNWPILLGTTAVMKCLKQEGRKRSGRPHPINWRTHGRDLGGVADTSRLRNSDGRPRRDRGRLPERIAILSRYCTSFTDFPSKGLACVCLTVSPQSRPQALPMYDLWLPFLIGQRSYIELFAQRRESLGTRLVSPALGGISAMYVYTKLLLSISVN